MVHHGGHPNVEVGVVVRHDSGALYFRDAPTTKVSQGSDVSSTEAGAAGWDGIVTEMAEAAGGCNAARAAAAGDWKFSRELNPVLEQSCLQLAVLIAMAMER